MVSSLWRWPKPSNCCPAIFPPQATTIDKGHGRIEKRQLWCLATDPCTIGLAGVGQILRIERDVDIVRKGQVIKHTHEHAFGITSYLPEEAGAEQLLQLTRDHWSIENGQHFRRDRTQDEDRCTVAETSTARNLSLLRSLAIFLFKTQPKRKGCPCSLPEFERHNHRKPWGLIARLTSSRHEE